jgi:hypothetical protein
MPPCAQLATPRQQCRADATLLALIDALPRREAAPGEARQTLLRTAGIACMAAEQDPRDELEWREATVLRIHDVQHLDRPSGLDVWSQPNAGNDKMNAKPRR